MRYVAHTQSEGREARRIFSFLIYTIVLKYFVRQFFFQSILLLLQCFEFQCFEDVLINSSAYYYYYYDFIIYCNLFFILWRRQAITEYAECWKRSHILNWPIKTIANDFRETVVLMTELQSSVKRFVKRIQWFDLICGTKNRRILPPDQHISYIVPFAMFISKSIFKK